MREWGQLAGLVLGISVVAPSASATSQAPECAIEASEWAPRGSATTARPRISVTLASTCNTAIEPASIRMTVDDEAVTPKVDGTGARVTVIYVPESGLVEEEDHTIVVQASDARGTTGEKSWTFRVADTYSR